MSNEKNSTANIFSLFWVCAGLFHNISSAEVAFQLGQGFVLAPCIQLAVFTCSVCYLILSGGNALFAAILVGQIVGAFLALPVIPNHKLLFALLNVGILADMWRRRGDPGEESFALCRSGALILYFFAVFHKLNVDHLDPHYSCATKFLQDIGEFYPSLSFLQSDWSPYLGLIIEGALVVALPLGGVIGTLAVVAGLVFHFVLAFHIERHFFDFSSMMFVLLWLFLPRDVANISTAVTQLRFRFLLALGFIIAFTALFFFREQAGIAIIIPTRMNLWAVFAVLFFLNLSLQFKKNRKDTRIKILPRSALSYSLVAVAIFNGLTPYLGLKTRSSFDMYSNLSIEGGRTNHLLFPDKYLGGIFTDDLVRPLVSTGPKVREDVLDLNRRMVRFDLMSLISRTPGLHVMFDDNGEVREAAKAEDVYKDGWTGNYLTRKFLTFRPVELPDHRAACQW